MDKLWEYRELDGYRQQVRGTWQIHEGILMFRKSTGEFILAVKEWKDVYEMEEE